MPSPLGLAQLYAIQGAGNPTPTMSGIAPTNVQQAYSDYNTAAMQAYQAKLAQQNAMWGGLAGLGSAGVLAASMPQNGTSMLSKLLSGFGGGSSSAAAPIAGVTSGAAPADAALSVPSLTSSGGTLVSSAADPLLAGGTGADLIGGTGAADLAGLGTTAADTAATGATAAGGTDILSGLMALLGFL